MTRYRFDQIAENSTAKKKPEESDRDRYVGLEHLDPGTLEVTRWGAEVTPKGDKLLMKKGDVLFGRRRAYQKKVGIAPFDGIFSAHGMVLRPKADVVDPMFFPFFISSDIFLDEAIRVSVGSLSPTANWKDLRTLEFDLPSPGKQRELAGILSEAESLKGHYRKMLTTCDDVVKSQFVEMFGDPIDNTFHKPIASFSDLGKWQSGGTPARSNTSYFEGGIDWYSAGELNGFHLRSSIEKITIEALNQSAAKLYPAGSLLVGMYDTAALKMGVLDKAAASNQACACLIPNDSVLVEWLYTAISIMKPHLLSQRKGCRQKNLSLKMIKGFNLPIADKAEQRDFAVFFHSVDKSKFAVQKALDELNATTKKILNQELGLGDV